jgi:uncharacterized protein YijF (DUF1287 family)
VNTISQRVFVSLAGLGIVAGAAPTQAKRLFAGPEDWAARLIAAAERQIGVTLAYDPGYTRIGYPAGDVPIERGVCTDVIVRAHRQGLGCDLQRLVHEDMTQNFSAYPKLWGLSGPDPNIDHRRVPNLKTFFRRKGRQLLVSNRAPDYRPGDIVTQLLPGGLAHIILLTDRASEDGERPLAVHNIGAGARLEDVLFAFTLTGHYRFNPAA